MCLIAFAINASQRWPLVIAANRDEFLDRPTAPLSHWKTPSGQDIFSGRDLRAGGTWLGFSPGGRVAFLTNVREAPVSGLAAAAAPLSRGELVTRWLEASVDAAAFAEALESERASYGGFNLVLGDAQRNAWTWVTNKSGDRSANATQPMGAAENHASTWHVQSLAPGVYGLSNAALNTPWPKTLALQTALAAALTASAREPDAKALQAQLWTALANRERAPRDKLPATGVPLALEEALSSAFVAYPEHGYGTRSSTVLLLSSAGAGDAAPDGSGENGAGHWQLHVEEQTHLPDAPRPVSVALAVTMAVNLPAPPPST